MIGMQIGAEIGQGVLFQAKVILYPKKKNKPQKYGLTNGSILKVLKLISNKNSQIGNWKATEEKDIVASAEIQQKKVLNKII